MNFLAIIVGGEGPDTWEREREITHAVDFMDAAQQAQAQADELGGFVFSLEQSIK
jgi:hypothetical protein